MIYKITKKIKFIQFNDKKYQTCPAVSKISKSAASPSITACCWYESSVKSNNILNTKYNKI